MERTWVNPPGLLPSVSRTSASYEYRRSDLILSAMSFIFLVLIVGMAPELIPGAQVHSCGPCLSSSPSWLWAWLSALILRFAVADDVAAQHLNRMPVDVWCMAVRDPWSVTSCMLNPDVVRHLLRLNYTSQICLYARYIILHFHRYSTSHHLFL